MWLKWLLAKSFDLLAPRNIDIERPKARQLCIVLPFFKLVGDPCHSIVVSVFFGYLCQPGELKRQRTKFCKNNSSAGAMGL
jgi:hypothetical protein